MRILISGGTGLIGSHLARKLLSLGHEVILLSRSKSQTGKIPISFWDPTENKIDKYTVASADVIIHLAGTNIGAGRWIAARKRSILESRVNTAKLLFNTVDSNTEKPGLFISASGVNYYGLSTSDKVFSESDPPGNDFLSRVCLQWEEAAFTFKSIGIRTVIFRNGLVLVRNGGIIKRLYLLFKAGLGVIPGTGSQYVPWIHIDDLCNMYIQAIENKAMNGVYNAVAPESVNFSKFAHDYASAINRKIFLPRVPSFLLKVALGEMATLILEGSRVSANKIIDSGFLFQYPFLKNAFEAIFRTQQ